MRRRRNDKLDTWAVLRVNTVIAEELKTYSGESPLPDLGLHMLTEIVAADVLVTG